MTTVYLYRDQAHYRGFELMGHAQYSDGNDIVCAALSMASITAINSLEILLAIKPTVTEDEKAGHMICHLPADVTEDELVKSDIIIGQLSIGLLGLAEQYPDNVVVYTREVL